MRHFLPACCHHKNQVTISSQIPYHVKLLAQISSPSAQACQPGAHYNFRKARAHHDRWRDVHTHIVTTAVRGKVRRHAHAERARRQAHEGKETRTRRERSTFTLTYLAGNVLCRHFLLAFQPHRRYSSRAFRSQTRRRPCRRWTSALRALCRHTGPSAYVLRQR
jgi:hypothetical protein